MNRALGCQLKHEHEGRLSPRTESYQRCHSVCVAKAPGREAARFRIPSRHCAPQTITCSFGSATSAGLLNASIIARDLGLADNKDHQSSNGSISSVEINPSDVSDLEMARRIAVILEGAKREIEA